MRIYFVLASREYLRNRKHVPCFYQVIQTQVEVWEKFGRTRNAEGTRAAGDCLHSFSEFSQTFTKHVPCFYQVIQTQVEVWENEKCRGNTSRRRLFPQLFRVLPNFRKCLYNSIETRSTCFLFLLKKNPTRKRKTTC